MSVLVNPIALKIPYPTMSRHPDLTLTRLLIVVATWTWQKCAPSILLRVGRVYGRSPLSLRSQTLRSSERSSSLRYESDLRESCDALGHPRLRQIVHEAHMLEPPGKRQVLRVNVSRVVSLRYLERGKLLLLNTLA